MSTTTTTTSTTTTTTLTGTTSLPRVLSVSKSPTHTISKTPVPSITLLPNHGVSGDCHAGKTTQHTTTSPTTAQGNNLRQIHLLPIESLRHISSTSSFKGTKPFTPGEIGENVTTEGIELGNLPPGTEIHFGNQDDGAVVVITSVREPGPGLDRVRPGLREAFRGVRKGYWGVLGVVVKGGEVKGGMGVRVVVK
ncbi:MOSC domain-containing protein [Aspergillus vadensis CBS 113365]|uniref:PK beta-barrel-protein domain-containing protein-like protein n=1 Tax=Aspergillus vadensis (strain CBS 113365 / IMI 142717 / IBT 24658) TaxID=1448311 RepID=A0A319BI76_ASPVC|nr:PK beta-barrel-protein domain-containing protein-like protein [Aspergillus vadensis CBS 113365]PYH70590.1 PK beta-barrel-protein domain-containing protein-like protein [Aspergillus vadensis CBS 113365]